MLHLEVLDYPLLAAPASTLSRLAYLLVRWSHKYNIAQGGLDWATCLFTALAMYTLSRLAYLLVKWSHKINETPGGLAWTPTCWLLQQVHCLDWPTCLLDGPKSTMYHQEV